MLEEFKHNLGEFYRQQSSDLLKKQLGISKAALNERTGRLNTFLSGGFAKVDESAMEVTVPYPIHIRFLDMKHGTRRSSQSGAVSGRGRKALKKARQGKLRENYVPIYNKYVYGYLKSATYRRLCTAVPAFMIKEFTLKK